MALKYTFKLLLSVILALYYTKVIQLKKDCKQLTMKEKYFNTNIKMISN